MRIYVCTHTNIHVSTDNTSHTPSEAIMSTASPFVSIVSEISGSATTPAVFATKSPKARDTASPYMYVCMYVCMYVRVCVFVCVYGG